MTAPPSAGVTQVHRMRRARSRLEACPSTSKADRWERDQASDEGPWRTQAAVDIARGREDQHHHPVADRHQARRPLGQGPSRTTMTPPKRTPTSRAERNGTLDCIPIPQVSRHCRPIPYPFVRILYLPDPPTLARHHYLTILQMRSPESSESPSLVCSSPTLPECGAETTISCVQSQYTTLLSSSGHGTSLPSSSRREWRWGRLQNQQSACVYSDERGSTYPSAPHCHL